MSHLRASQIGSSMERLAKLYLEERDLQIVESNYRCKAGEIDIIIRDSHSLAFVEVRYRKTTRYGSAAESVDQRKQEKLRQTAQHYIQSKKLHCTCRFDVIAITGPIDRPNIDWIKNAF